MTTNVPTRDLTLESRVLSAVARIDAVLARTPDRRQQNEWLDVRLLLTGRPA